MYYINIVWAECCIPPNLMGDHGTMARGTHAGVQDEGRQAASGIAFLVLSEMNAMAALMKDPGAAQEALRRWRNRSDAAVVEESKQSARDTMAELKQLRAENAELRRVNEIPATASAFRGTDTSGCTQLIAQGWDSQKADRDQVMRIMRGLGIRDIKSGRMPVTTKSAQGTGGRPILVGCRFEAVAPICFPWPTLPTCV